MVKDLFPREIVAEERHYRDTDRQILRESSPIEGPLRPAIVAVGDIAIYTTYGLSVIARSLRKHRPSREPEDRTPRNAFLD